MIEQVIETLAARMTAHDRMMLMMSGGWDSRTLLAISMACEPEAIKQLYFHGAITSREAGIVADLAARSFLPVNMEPIGSHMFGAQANGRYLIHDENLVFPHWHYAAERAMALNCDSVMAGVYGEILGGHYGPPAAMKGLNRAAAVLMYASAPRAADRRFRRALSAEDIDVKGLMHRQTRKPWYLAKSAHNDWADEYNKKTYDDTAEVLARYKARGIQDAESIYEAFITEHRGAQLIATQLRCMQRQGLALKVPFGGRRALELATAIRFSAKAHNKVNQRIIEKCAPTLLHAPHASSLVSARRAVFWQECSRIARKAMDESGPKTSRFTRGYVKGPNSSWVEFSFLPNSGVLESLTESLRSDFWDREGMVQMLARGSQQSPHSVFDMCNKIVTVDRIISGSER